ncbi:MAG: Tim44 domain-containing protein [Candidatus Rokubacteria bacterium]|nr:Tim44 domain-containing protein [Candidatus Rokubacteria bacterium]
MTSRASLLVIGLAITALFLADTAAVWARAGGGGSRGSRSYSAPVRPSSPAMPTTPSRSLSQPGPSAPQRPGMFGGLMGGLAGFALGGLLGSMLFGGLGGFGGGLGGFGLLEMLIVGAVIFFAVRMFRSRQASQPAPAYAGAAAGGSAYGTASPSWSGAAGGGAAVAEAPAAPSDLERGLGFVRQMDAGFDPDAFTRWAQAVFNDVQQGIGRRDVSALNDRLTPQEYARLQAQCDQLRGARQTNRIEQIVINRAELSEAWQESGQDWATVYFAVSLVDYTVDDTSGGLVDGSKSPQSVEEFWTFTRPVGPKPWRLSAIQPG